MSWLLDVYASKCTGTCRTAHIGWQQGACRTQLALCDCQNYGGTKLMWKICLRLGLCQSSRVWHLICAHYKACVKTGLAGQNTHSCVLQGQAGACASVHDQLCALSVVVCTDFHVCCSKVNFGIAVLLITWVAEALPFTACTAMHHCRAPHIMQASSRTSASVHSMLCTCTAQYGQVTSNIVQLQG